MYINPNVTTIQWIELTIAVGIPLYIAWRIFSAFRNAIREYKRMRENDGKS